MHASLRWRDTIGLRRRAGQSVGLMPLFLPFHLRRGQHPRRADGGGIGLVKFARIELRLGRPAAETDQERAKQHDPQQARGSGQTWPRRNRHRRARAAAQ